MYVNRQVFESWARDKAIEYTATTVDGPRPDVRARLVSLAFVGGGYKIAKGGDTLYVGDSFEDAATTFNQAAT
ncbi:UNVERIFIED_ORG: hypothetical protein J2Y81_007804 [Paraburkholderia sediminicola]|nr:hypothetical protein [Paraburkholderia sediminicola]